MITPEQLETALRVLTDEEAAAEAYLKEMRAETELDRIYDTLFIGARGEGGVEVRKALARIHPDYQAAKKEYELARANLKAYEARVAGAKAVQSTYQTQSANARQSEWIR